MSEEIHIDVFFKLLGSYKSKILDWWVGKRFQKVKPITVSGDPMEEIQFVPLDVVDGNEDKEGTGRIEVSFDNVCNSNDIIVTANSEDKEVSLSDQRITFWINTEGLEQGEEFALYYGCDRKWAKLLDRFLLHRVKGE